MLTREQLERQVPAAFNMLGPSAKTSERYRFLPTLPLIEEFERQGFRAVQASQQRSRFVGGEDFARHVLRFEHPEISRTTLQALGDSKLQVILDTAHNGTRAHTLMVGIFRLICLNGMTVHTAGTKSRIIHTGSAADQLESAFQNIKIQLPIIVNNIMHMQRTEIDDATALRYAENVLEARLKTDISNIDPMTVTDVLAVRRKEDAPNTAWCIMNRVQENLRNGTVRRWTTDNKLRHLNKVTSVTALETINKITWQKARMLHAV